MSESGVENSYNQKTIEPVFSNSMGRAGSAKPSEPRNANGLTLTQESNLRIMKEQLFSQNKNI